MSTQSEDYTHLHLHTQYSFLDGAIRMPDLISKVSELGMKSVAVTDHGNMFGACDFYQRAKKADIKPIIGIEAYCTGVTGDVKHTDRVRENFHLVLLAENDIGYANLRKLSSKSFIDGKYYYPRVDKDLLYEHREGIIASSACLGGEIGRKGMKGDVDGLRETAKTFRDIFGKDNYFLEIQPNGVKEQEKLNPLLKEIAAELGIRNVLTNDCHYVTQKDHEAQNVLMAIRQQKSYDDPKLHKHETDAFYIRSGETMFDLAKGEYQDAFQAACDIGKRCNVEMDLGTYYLPPYPFPKDEAKDESDYLRHLSREGLEQRFKEFAYKVDREEYFARLDVELDVINGMGFPGYFLIVQEFINWSKNHQIRVGPGRGSGAGSLVAFALRITDLDPLPYNLLFERFLNPERVSMPDFDVDFMQARRGEVIQHVADKYGRDRVGQIATYSGMHPKSAIKDVARTLGVTYSEINELTKPIPVLLKPNTDAEKAMSPFQFALTHVPDLVKRGREEQLFKKTLEVAETLTGLFRQAGMHAGGVVIGQEPLTKYAPLFTGKNNELITQFDKDKVEDAGLVKFDFLGLKTLDVIEYAQTLVNNRIDRENGFAKDKGDPVTGKKRQLRAVRKHPHCEERWRGGGVVYEAGDENGVGSGDIPHLNIDLLRPDHPAIFKLIASGDTLGVFQVESSGFREMCRKLKPDCFEDIIAAVALYRPGPMDAGMVDDFIERKHGRKRVEYPHPMLDGVLGPTYGTIVYQEQVMQSAQVLAGYSLGGADILRRAMGKKKIEVMQQQRLVFCEGAAKNGIDEQVASDVFTTIEKFAGYGFNKSHSAAYALITYQTAYLKTFYPVEFMAALLTTESGSTESVVKYIHEAKTHGIKVLPPDVNISERSFSVDYNVDEETRRRREFRNTNYGMIRFGLSAIKGLGDAALESIVAERADGGDFESLHSFCERMATSKVSGGKINKKVVEVLTKSGGMDSFCQSRARIVGTIDVAIASALSARKDAKSGQTSMFDVFAAATPASAPTATYADVPEWSQKEQLGFERESIGFYLSGHPLDRYVDDVKKMGAMPTVELLKCRHNSEASIVGIVAGLKERLMKDGESRWAVITLEDTFGQAEVLCFSKVYAEAEEAVKSGEPLLIVGRALLDDIDDEGQQMVPKMRAAMVTCLADEQMARTRRVDITVEVPILEQRPYDEDELPFDPRREEHGSWDKYDEKALRTVEQIREVCEKHVGEKPLSLQFVMPAGYRVGMTVEEELRIDPTEDFVSALEHIPGVARVVRL
ncbi:MAG: DNA polymerase III subunit alpha [Deltaproteobacteria bacterium]|nr:DNA polymerase III subunit alpha [Deltaproteobacteria bacterium]